MKALEAKILVVKEANRLALTYGAPLYLTSCEGLLRIACFLGDADFEAAFGSLVEWDTPEWDRSPGSVWARWNRRCSQISEALSRCLSARIEFRIMPYSIAELPKPAKRLRVDTVIGLPDLLTEVEQGERDAD